MFTITDNKLKVNGTDISFDVINVYHDNDLFTEVLIKYTAINGKEMRYLRNNIKEQYILNNNNNVHISTLLMIPNVEIKEDMTNKKAIEENLFDSYMDYIISADEYCHQCDIQNITENRKDIVLKEEVERNKYNYGKV